ncbi:hypothetical protein PHYSODRAFT_492885 [Phytophthora sojae]|uniref:Uncharacterized protein n=1 Tax=Phytophthora sojae (strain P6497) TaxID=1094619 RepID=G4ZCA5_PHYSP|nr:hypothetical protein PHYSODRAFT_492885 [Phytophthora sojae]EGZ22133.1 hypothetical protein PHYSODRAFT_492885 [Phytophthora sojae]|eukprot:XP_009524850.1 hypothetical protein PHYSODRAFT_492885 [Phytophthora sojae]
MATVRTTVPRGAEPNGGGGGGNNKRKRKRVGKAKEAAAAPPSAASVSVDAQLQTLENWHRALTVDMRELRREGARVRVELEKVDDTAEAAVVRAEHWKSSARSCWCWTRSWSASGRAASTRSSS